MLNPTCANARKKRNGFTLVELCVVIALIAIVTVMTVSFSLLIEKDVHKNQTKYDFIDEVALIREESLRWFSNHDVSSNTISLSVTGALNGIADPRSVMNFNSNGTFDFYYEDTNATDRTLTLKTVKKVEFDCHGENLVICTVTGGDAYGDKYTQTFMIALRAATIGG